MSAPDTSAYVAQRRPLLGLRRKPGRLALALFRMPLRAYRHNAGWMLGRTFVEFTHLGRNTGQPHQTVAMVLRYDEVTRESVICAARGPGENRRPDLNDSSQPWQLPPFAHPGAGRLTVAIPSHGATAVIAHRGASPSTSWSR